MLSGKSGVITAGRLKKLVGDRFGRKKAVPRKG
jgi:hypothetical protein